MAIRKYNPTSPGQRFQTVQVFDEITTTTPYKPLTEPLHSTGGRDSIAAPRPMPHNIATTPAAVR